MKAGNLAVRTLTTLASVALFAALVLLLPYQHHLAFNAGLTAAAVLGALEMAELLRKRGAAPYRFAAPLSGLLPAVTYLEVRGLLAGGWSTATFIALGCCAVLPGLWVTPSRGRDLSGALPRTAATLFVLAYPAALLSFVVRLSGLPRPTETLALFFALVAGNDMLAYLVGTFLGSGTRLNYSVSPNKSALGFAGGLAGSVGAALGFVAIFRGELQFVLPCSALGWAVALGLAIGVLTICGDLVESVFKRSAGVKDSGRLIPGRGGVLDSIDSWLLAAPVFYAIVRGLNWSR